MKEESGGTESDRNKAASVSAPVSKPDQSPFVEATQAEIEARFASGFPADVDRGVIAELIAKARASVGKRIEKRVREKGKEIYKVSVVLAKTPKGFGLRGSYFGPTDARVPTLHYYERDGGKLAYFDEGAVPSNQRKQGDGEKPPEERGFRTDQEYDPDADFDRRMEENSEKPGWTAAEMAEKELLFSGKNAFPVATADNPYVARQGLPLSPDLRVATRDIPTMGITRGQLLIAIRAPSGGIVNVQRVSGSGKGAGAKRIARGPSNPTAIAGHSKPGPMSVIGESYSSITAFQSAGMSVDGRMVQSFGVSNMRRAIQQELALARRSGVISKIRAYIDAAEGNEGVEGVIARLRDEFADDARVEIIQVEATAENPTRDLRDVLRDSPDELRGYFDGVPAKSAAPARARRPPLPRRRKTRDSPPLFSARRTENMSP